MIMRRRRYLQLFLGSTISISGCANIDGDSNPEADSSVQINKSLCDDTESTVEMTNFTDNSIGFRGVISGVAKKYGITASHYISSEDESIVCIINASEQWSPPSVDCQGSIEYSGEIKYSNINVSEIVFIHKINQEQNFGENITLES
ncbi:hypothetical protein [Natrinema marinum]|uniref:hypothetical protein n=1 Tax=Natrinema marinum TaxID=2961598 RepID=UPI0020C8B596|nr:hypothetical protein [Natrinema marinum]